MGDTPSHYVFGPFRLDPAARVLTRDGVPLTLNARAFDVLFLLAQHAGTVVARQDIRAAVWRGVTVDDNNLAVQVSSLRRALGDRPDGSPWIVTVPNQGYCLAGPVTRDAAAPVTGIAEALPAVRRFRWWLPVAACIALVLAGWTGARLLHAHAVALQNVSPPATPDPPPRLSIAILPFRDLSDDHSGGALADAVSDDLTTEMAHMPAATVAARESADIYKGRAVPMDQIGRALNVRYVLEGSLRNVGDRVAVNAQLIAASTGMHLWAQRFEVPRDPITDAQPTIVYRVASALATELIAAAAAVSLRERPDNPDAMDLYLRAGAIWNRQESLPSMATARPLLEQAIKLQPDFVPALASLGTEMASDVGMEGPVGNPTHLAEAHRLIDRALGLARNDPSVLAAQGFVLLMDGKVVQADAVYRAALAIDPGNRRAMSGLWMTAAALAHWQIAYDDLQRLQQIDPLGPGAQFRGEQMGIMLLMLGHPAEAAQDIERGVASWPAPGPGVPMWDAIGSDRLWLIAAKVMSGDLEGGRAMLAADNRVWPHRSLFRVGDYASKAEAHDQGVMRVYAALREAGLPDFADEHADDGVAATATPVRHGDLDATPTAVPGVPTIDTTALAKLVRTQPAPMLIDMGVGVATPPGAVAGKFDPLSADSVRTFINDPANRGDLFSARPVVVFGDGTYGWRSYNAVLQLKAAGVEHLQWYRGGEEAWAKAGLPAQDTRTP